MKSKTYQTLNPFFQNPMAKIDSKAQTDKVTEIDTQINRTLVMGEIRTSSTRGNLPKFGWHISNRPAGKGSHSCMPKVIINQKMTWSYPYLGSGKSECCTITAEHISISLKDRKLSNIKKYRKHIIDRAPSSSLSRLQYVDRVSDGQISTLARKTQCSKMRCKAKRISVSSLDLLL